MDKKPLLIIVGPTAIGKTKLSIEAALALKGEIVSADSMQIYKYMDIGTAKPSIDERRKVLHHMIDIVDPDSDYSVALYQKDALEAINKIHEKGKIPILTGGTGLYINSIRYSMDFSPAAVDREYRNELNNIYKERGSQYVYDMLRKVDSETAARLHPNDKKRVIRALEIYKLTGRTMADHRQDFKNKERPYRFVIIGLNMDRKKLYNRIDTRVDSMIEAGLVKEVEGLLNRGYKKELTSMQGLGYKQIINYLEGNYTLDTAIEEIKKLTRRYAKRQLTWFRQTEGIDWINLDEIDKEVQVDWIIMHIKKNLAL